MQLRFESLETSTQRLTLLLGDLAQDVTDIHSSLDEVSVLVAYLGFKVMVNLKGRWLVRSSFGLNELDPR